MARLLLVDDEPNVLSALKRALRQGFGEKRLTVEAINSPLLALDRASEMNFDLVVSDFRMPEMDGVQFLQMFKALQPDTVRIMLSASAEVATLMRAMNDVGVLRFIVKPWQDDDLILQITAGLEKVTEVRHDRELADAMRVQRGEISAEELERRRLEALEPGITKVEWGADGSVLMPDLLDPGVDPFKR